MAEPKLSVDEDLAQKSRIFMQLTDLDALQCFQFVKLYILEYTDTSKPDVRRHFNALCEDDVVIGPARKLMKDNPQASESQKERKR